MRLILLAILLLPRWQQAPVQQARDNTLRISGTVVDANSGIPVREAAVFITHGRTTVSVLSSSDGGFTFEHLEPGKYALSARGKGYQQQMFDQHENFSTAIVVGDDQDTGNIVFRLFPEGSIAGQVTDEFSEAVRNARVMLFREEVASGKKVVRQQTQVSTDDRGRYRFAPLQAGPYYLAVSAQPWYAQYGVVQPGYAGSDPREDLQRIHEQNANLDVVYPVTYYPRETDASRASTIALQPGEQSTANVVLQPVPALHLRVTIPGRGLPENFGFQVQQPTLGNQVVFVNAQVAYRDMDYIELAGVPPGHVFVSLNTNAGPENGREVHRFQQEVNATRNVEVSLIESVINSGPAVSGTVEVAGGAALPPPAGIGLLGIETGGSTFANVSKEGKFEFQNLDLKPGRYIVIVGNAPGFYIDKLQAVGAGVSGDNLEVRNTAQVRLTVHISRGIGQVGGVALRDAKPVAGAMILLIPHDSQDDPTRFHRDQSDSDGSFTLPQISPGRYTLVAIEKGWNQQWADPSVFKSWLSNGEAVEVAASGTYRIEIKVQ